jgi:hypothetical protein
LAKYLFADHHHFGYNTKLLLKKTLSWGAQTSTNIGKHFNRILGGPLKSQLLAFHPFVQ